MAGEFKRYLISFQTTLAGKEMVLTSLKQMEGQIKGTTKVTEAGAKATKGFGENIARLASRAVLTIPIWLLMRRAFMTVVSTIGQSIQAFKDLDDQLARIRTVMHGNTAVIEAQMVAIRSQILETATKSRIPLKELAEGFYFLKTSNLDAREAMEAFDATVSLAVGTNNKMAESARAVAGIYNTMGKYLGDNLTIHEKFQHISDVLAYTYSTQDVQLSELIESYTKLAPYVTGLEDSFLELTTTLGFLNTRLLRGGRTGRLTGRAILQLTKNAEKLANQFGITFDPNKPINLLNTIKQIHQAMGQGGKITAQQGQQIQEAFATRGGVAIRLLLEHFEDLDEQIQDAVLNADGFAKKMKEIRMGTINAQAERMKNIFAMLTHELVTGMYGTKDLAEAMKMLGDSLETLAIPMKRTGELLQFITYNYGMLATLMDRMKPTSWQDFVPGLGTIRQINQFKDALAGIEFKSWQDILKADKEMLDAEIARQKAIEELTNKQNELTTEATELYKKGEDEKAKAVEKRIEETKKSILELMPAEVQYQDLLAKKEKARAETQKIQVGFIDKYNEETKHQLALMKALGANSLDMVKYELERLENMEIIADEAKYELELLKQRNKVTQEEYNYRRSIVDTLQKAEVDMLKVMGASELQILNVKEKQLEAEKSIIGETAYLTKLTDLRLQREIALQQEKQKELDIATNAYLAYEKADKLERNRIERLIELMSMRPEELAGKVRKDMYDKQIILQYWNYFSEQAHRAMGEAIRSMRHLRPVDLPAYNVPNIRKQLLTTDLKEQINKLQIVPTVGEINVNLPEGSLDNMAETVGKEVTNKLKTDTTLQKTLAKLLRPYI